MLLEFEVSNILSFKNKNTFSMQAGYSRAEIFNSNTIYQGIDDDRKKFYVHNSAILYGANASGKSNLFFAISYLKRIVSSSYQDPQEAFTFRFTDEAKPAELGIRFIQNVDNDDYEFYYKISITTEGRILNESLTSKKITKKSKAAEQIIFTRELDEFIDFHKDLSFLVENYKTNNIDTKAVLSFLINDINKSYFKETMNTFGYKLLVAAYQYIIDKIVVSSDMKDRSTIANKLITNPKLKEKVIYALNEIDNSIEDFEIIDLSDLIASKFAELLKSKPKANIPEEFLADIELIKSKKKRVYDFKTIHKVDEEAYSLEYDLESSGTRKFIDEFIDIVDCIENNKLYIVDEIENHYHEYIQRYIINLFQTQEEGNTAQIITSTHSVEFLDPTRFAKEQIWFVEKDRNDQQSFLYRLSDFKEISYNNHNWKNLYLQGRLGAVPKVIM